MRLTTFVCLLVIPLSATAAPKLDLSHLGKPLSQNVEPIEKASSTEEEVISSQVYTSGRSEIGARRNVELAKPTADDLHLDAPKPVVNQPSALAFVDEALGINPVKPWQKGTLAKKEMKPGGPVPEFDLFSEKVFSYKQGSVGGGGVGGGGCGCN
ncbi:DUF4266 domain-containing protein [Vibrio ostreicida]|uniref:DUF4266 domain-containing protein n=1 Tax=Vibrio ostreicida TaxID=526588 RepID=A0ABT8C244_9VIBR|nr:DUF4266 domain-containing protein [Vibrio ostreicida]MDN3612290.1 DUF4266 domain-containing protein [Vibrio ostreicida]NPD08673.1 DUF4266 domain-containing protein [Vibrio ostreicida]